MRVSALCALNVGDLRPDRTEVAKRCPSCHGSVAGSGEMKEVTIARLHEKGGKVWDILVADEAVYYLSLYLQLRGSLGPDQPLFTSTRDGNRLSRLSVYRRLKLHAEKAGITDTVSPHALRRAAIAWWHDVGVPGDTIQSYVGHSDPATTRRYKDITTRSYGLSGIAGSRNLLRVMAKQTGLGLDSLLAPDTIQES